MKTIWKFPIPITDHVEVMMPEGAEILTMSATYSELTIWALVDTDNPRVVRKFDVYGTGHPVNAEPGVYIGTAETHDGRYVWHLFEDRPVEDVRQTIGKLDVHIDTSALQEQIDKVLEQARKAA